MTLPDPQHQGDGAVEKGGICGDWHTQTGSDQVFLEARREGGMRQKRRDIGHDLGRGDGFSIGGGKMRDQGGLDVRDRRGGVAPEGKNTTTASMVVVLIWDVAGNR